MPSWADWDFLRTTATVTAIGAIVVTILVLVLFRNAPWRTIVCILLIGIAAASFFYRTRLDRCEDDCDCKFLDDKITIDGCEDDAATAVGSGAGGSGSEGPVTPQPVVLPLG
jgi:hypothetical protein